MLLLSLLVIKVVKTNSTSSSNLEYESFVSQMERAPLNEFGTLMAPL